jgi:hypothetical protein
MLTRRFVALATSALLLIEILFPPFDPPRTTSYGHYPMSYWFLFSAPCADAAGHYCGTVNVALLALELIVTLAIGWLLIRFVAKE